VRRGKLVFSLPFPITCAKCDFLVYNDARFVVAQAIVKLKDDQRRPEALRNLGLILKSPNLKPALKPHVSLLRTRKDTWLRIRSKKATE
jgi:hypothetical protein